MASQAYTDHLIPLLNDVDELQAAHKRLRTGQRGRQWGLGALNRATVVMCVSSWEAYIEQVTIEVIELLKPPSQPLGHWQLLNASTRGAIGRFHTPNASNVRMLLRDSIGLNDITTEWYWQNCPPAKAMLWLDELLTFRHQIAHGAKPRPVIHSYYSSWVSGFIKNLARCTDRGLKNYLQNSLGMSNVF